MNFDFLGIIKVLCERSKDADRGRNLSDNLFKPLHRLAETSKPGILKKFFLQIYFQASLPLGWNLMVRHFLGQFSNVVQFFSKNIVGSVH